MPIVTIGQNTGNTSGLGNCVGVSNNAAVNTQEIAMWDITIGSARNSWLDFSDAALNTIPASATVNSATLEFNLLSAGAASDALQLYQCLRNIDTATATWNEFSTGNSWGTAGGTSSGVDRAASAIGSFTPGTTTVDALVSWTNANLTALVQGWVNGSINRYGVQIVPNASFVNVAFRNNSSTDGLRPRLVIDYTASGSKKLLTLGVG